MFCIFFPDIYIKENSKFQSIRTLGLKAQGRRQQTDTGTHRIYTVTRHQGWADASSPVSVMIGENKHRFPQGSGKLSWVNS